MEVEKKEWVVSITIWVLVVLAAFVLSHTCNSQPPHIRLALSYEGVKEDNNNRGALIDKINKHAGSPLGSSYCANFGRFVLDSVKAVSPAYRPPVATAWLRNKSVIKANDVYYGKVTAPSGAVIVWRNGGSWQGHLGFLIKFISKVGMQTIEANTSPSKAGSQTNGGGIYRRIRNIAPFAYFKIEGFVPVGYEQEPMLREVSLSY